MFLCTADSASETPIGLSNSTCASPTTMHNSSTSSASSSSSKHITKPKRSSHPSSDSQLPPFRNWQARQLATRDLLFGTFLLLLFLIYLRKSVPQLCKTGPYPLEQQQQQRQEWPLTWRIVCGHPLYPLETAAAGAAQGACPAHDTAAPAAAAAAPGWPWLVLEMGSQLLIAAGSKCIRLLLALLRAFFTFFASGLLTGDPIYIIMPPLRLAMPLLMLVPLPCPNLAALWQKVGCRRRRKRTSAAEAHTSTVPNDSSSSSRFVAWYLPCYYWQYPQLRQAVIIAQRLLPSAVAAAFLGSARLSSVSALLHLRYWQLGGKYMYQGWTAFMLVLPLRIHIALSICEWLLLYSSAVRTNNITSGSNSVLDIYHLTVSFFFITLLPTLGVMWLERAQQARYQKMQQPARRAAATSTTQPQPQQQQQQPLQQQQQHQQEHQQGVQHAAVGARDDQHLSLAAAGATPKPWSTKNSRRPSEGSSSDSLTAPLAPHPSGASSADGISSNTAAGDTAADLGSSSIGKQFLADIASSLHLAASLPAAAAAVPSPGPLAPTPGLLTSAHTATPVDQAGSDARLSGLSGLPSGLSGLMPSLSSLLADEAAAVFAAAAAAASNRAGGVGAAAPGAMPFYTSMAQCLPVSCKVHTSHSDVSLLAPLLTDSLAAQLTPPNAGSCGAAVWQSVCFAGCVQLLANVFTVPGTTRGGNSEDVLGDGVADNSGTVTDSRTGQLAAALLTSISEGMRTLNAAGHAAVLTADSKATTDAAGSAAAVLPPAGPGSSPDSQAAASQAQAGSPDSSESWQPDIDVMVGGSLATSSKATRAGTSSSSSAAVCSVSLQGCQPACLTAGKQQQLNLTLQVLSGLQQAAPPGRLLVFRDGSVLMDEEVALHKCSISVGLPAQPPGLLHVALLPGTQPQLTAAAKPGEHLEQGADLAADVQAAAVTTHAAPDPVALAAAGPLLLVPLPVLPEAAANEVQQYCEAAAAAVVRAGSSSSSSSSARPTAAWQAAVAPITTDIAYIMAACSTAQAATAPATAPGKVRDSAEGSCQQRAVLPEGLRRVLQHLLLHLAGSGMWDTMNFLVHHTAAAFGVSSSDSSNPGSRGGAATAAAKGTACEIFAVSGSATASSSNTGTGPLCGTAAATAAPPNSANAATMDDGALINAFGASSAGCGHGGSSTADSAACAAAPSSSSCSAGGSLGGARTGLEKAPAPAAANGDPAAAAVDGGPPAKHSKSQEASAGCGAGFAGAAVPASQLLWGFEDPSLESSYQAAAFSATGTLDAVTCIYYGVMSLGCYFARGGKLVQQQQQQGAGQSGFILAIFNQLLVMAFSLSGPLGVLLLRLRVAQRLQALAHQQQQQQQQQENTTAAGKQQNRVSFEDQPSNGHGTCSNTTSRSSRGSPKQQQQQQPESYAALAAAELVRAARAKQLLLMAWMVLIPTYGLLLLSGWRFIIPPMMVTKAWATCSWSTDLGAITSHILKGWVCQVPFAWFWPVLVVQSVINTCGSIKSGLRPLYWLGVRYGLCLLLPVATSAMQQVQGRRQFCTRHGIVVVGGSRGQGRRSA